LLVNFGLKLITFGPLLVNFGLKLVTFGLLLTNFRLKTREKSSKTLDLKGSDFALCLIDPSV